MSATLERRVLGVHPLSPAYRMVLFYVARHVPDGQSEAMVNRAAVARALDTTGDLVGKALLAGREVGLCRVLQNGRVAFTAYDGLLGVEPVVPVAERRTPVVAVEPKGGEVARPETTTAMVYAAFGKRWTERYKQRCVMADASYPMLAKRLCALTPEELDQRLDAYFADPDPFWSDCKHSFGSFARNVHRFVPTPKRQDPARRVPDAEATRRQNEQMRAEARRG